MNKVIEAAFKFSDEYRRENRGGNPGDNHVIRVRPEIWREVVRACIDAHYYVQWDFKKEVGREASLLGMELIRDPHLKEDFVIEDTAGNR